MPAGQGGGISQTVAHVVKNRDFVFGEAGLQQPVTNGRGLARADEDGDITAGGRLLSQFKIELPFALAQLDQAGRDDNAPTGGKGGKRLDRKSVV